MLPQQTFDIAGLSSDVTVNAKHGMHPLSDALAVISDTQWLYSFLHLSLSQRGGMNMYLRCSKPCVQIY